MRYFKSCAVILNLIRSKVKVSRTQFEIFSGDQIFQCLLRDLEANLEKSFRGFTRNSRLEKVSRVLACLIWFRLTKKGQRTMKVF